MDWQQKLDAIQAFAGKANLCMRRPNDWFVESGMSVGGDGILSGKYGNGTTPEEAVEEHWHIYSELPPDRYAVNRHNRRARWNGYMWREISEDEAAAMLSRAA